jgi:GTPase SAR1 family protein
VPTLTASATASCLAVQRSPDAPVWGQVVVGPPGAGKTTYCAGMQQFLTLAGRRVAVINLDPANDAVLPYTPAVDIGELVSLEGVQQELGLGPNGGLVYCLEYLEQNLDWLAERLAPLEAGELSTPQVARPPL